MPDKWGRATFGYEWDLERWTTGATDSEGHLVWHHSYPDDRQWRTVYMVTLNLDPQGGGEFRNYQVSPLDANGRLVEPLDPYDPNEVQDDEFTIADLATNALQARKLRLT